MKKITKKQMKELKGQLNNMNYDPANPNNGITVQLTGSNSESQDDICKVKHWVGDAS
jgi:hypothetical protein